MLRLQEFRLLTLAVSFNTFGEVAEQVVLGWLTLELTDSPLMVGVALGMRMAPLFFFGIPAGILADRADRNHLLRATSAAKAGASVALALLVFGDAVQVWHLLLLTFAAGCLRALNNVARQSYAHDVVGPGRLVDGLAVLGFATRIGGLLGALAAGPLIARLGAGAAYLAVAAGHLASVVALRHPPAGAGGPPGSGETVRR
ncbi:MAG: MFS transporter, partial [Candidatus Rokuibacteriota bacterium]